jgi:hypothetical protein
MLAYFIGFEIGPVVLQSLESAFFDLFEYFLLAWSKNRYCFTTFVGL